MARILEKLAFHSEHSGSCFVYTIGLKNLVDSESYTKCLKLPVGVVTVFGSADVANKKLHTDWLIEYYENGQKVNTKDDVSFFGALKHMPDRLGPLPNVLFWPKLYKVKAATTAEPIICLILYIDGVDSVLEELAVNLCSQAIVFNSIEEDNLRRMLSKYSDNYRLRNMSYIQAVSNPIDPLQPNAASYSEGHFMQLLDSHKLVPLLSFDGKVVCLGDLLVYLDKVKQLVNEKINPASNAWVSKHVSTYQCHISEDNSRQKNKIKASATSGGTAVSSSSTVLNYEDQKAKVDHEHKTADVTTQTVTSVKPTGQVPTDTGMNEGAKIHQSGVPEANFNAEGLQGQNKSSTSDSTCKTLGCDSFHKEMLSAITKWMNSQSQYWSSDEMFSFIKTIPRKDVHDHFVDIEQVCKLVEIFSSDIRNTFDNYTCFYGDDDRQKLVDFGTKAYNRVLVLLSKDKIAHEEFMKTLLSKACTCIYKIFQRHNKLIAEKEMALAKQVKEKALRACSSKLEIYQSKSKSVDEMEHTHNRLQQHLLTIVSRCMDNVGRINGVQANLTTEIVKFLDQKIEAWKNEKLEESTYQNQNSVLNAVKIYENTLEKIYHYPLKFRQGAIVQYHTDSLNKILLTLKGDHERQQARHILQGHLIHILMNRCEKLQISSRFQVPKNPVTHTLCIYLTPNWLRVDTMTSKGQDTLHSNKVNINTPYHPAQLALRPNSEVVFGFHAKDLIDNLKGDHAHQGSIECFLSNQKHNDKNAKFMLTGCFKTIKMHAERCFEYQYSGALVLVPSWYNEDYLLRIRESSDEAGFVETYTLKESSVIAHKILELERRKENTAELLAVSIQIAPMGIKVEIYVAKGEDPNITQLVGLSFVNFEPEAQSGGSFWSQIVGGKAQSKPYNDVQALPLNGTEKLYKAYEQAFQLLSPTQRKCKTYCFLLTDNDAWESNFQDFTAQRPELIIFTNVRENFAVMGGCLLSLDAENIRSLIVDYLKLNERSPLARQNMPQNKSHETNIDEPFVSKQEIERNNQIEDEKLQTQKAKLLSRCKLIRDKIDRGEVRIRKLMQKVINETLEKAEEVASSEHSNLAEIEFEINEIRELIKEHNLK